MSNEKIAALLAILPPGEDVPFDKIHKAMFGWMNLDATPAEVQRRISPYISKANLRLRNEVIIPGERKQTYRRVSL